MVPRYTAGCHSAIKKKKTETMPFAVIWMALEILTLSQTENDKHHMISLICEVRQRKTNIV